MGNRYLLLAYVFSLAVLFCSLVFLGLAGNPIARAVLLLPSGESLGYTPMGELGPAWGCGVKCTPAEASGIYISAFRLPEGQQCGPYIGSLLFYNTDGRRDPDKILWSYTATTPVVITLKSSDIQRVASGKPLDFIAPDLATGSVTVHVGTDGTLVLKFSMDGEEAIFRGRVDTASLKNEKSLTVSTCKGSERRYILRGIVSGDVLAYRFLYSYLRANASPLFSLPGDDHGCYFLVTLMP